MCTLLRDCSRALNLRRETSAAATSPVTAASPAAAVPATPATVAATPAPVADPTPNPNHRRSRRGSCPRLFRSTHPSCSRPHRPTRLLTLDENASAPPQPLREAVLHR